MIDFENDHEKVFWRETFLAVLSGRHANESITGHVHSKTCTHVHKAEEEADRAVSLYRKMYPKRSEHLRR